jgi:hypothetical protein
MSSPKTSATCSDSGFLCSVRFIDNSIGLGVVICKVFHS